MAIKDVITTGIAVLSLATSGLAAYFAHGAREEAQRFDERRFATETSMQLLRQSFEEITAVEGDPDRGRERRLKGCIFVNYLQQVERATAPAVEGRPPGRAGGVVEAFVSELRVSNLWPPACDIGAEATYAEAASETPETPETPAPPGSDGLGRHHAVIASYDATARGCEFARADVQEFARLLGGAGSARAGLAGLELGVVRTQQSNHYAVTVDAGDDAGRAQDAVEAVRAAAGRTSDGRTGRDAFVQQNRDWRIEPACDERAVIG